MEYNELAKKIRLGDIESIMQGFASKSILENVWSIIGTVNNRIVNDEIKKQLTIRTKDDENRVAGYKVSDYANAALHVLGIKKYEGNSPGALALMKSKTWFE